MRRITNFQPGYIGLIVLLPFILFWRWVLMGEVLYWGTLLLQFWPWHTLVKTSLFNGEWPLWNPLLGNGTPLLANLQSAVFYPPNVIYLLIPVEHALTLTVILHLILAGVLMYFYTRYLGLTPFAAVISALTYMLSGYLLGRTQFVPMVNAAAWMPLLLLLSDKLVTHRGGIYIIWLALALAVQFLAGHAQLWFYGLWLLGGYVVFRGWQTAHSAGFRGSEFRPQVLGMGFVLKSVGILAFAVGLALLISAVQILPTVEFVQQSLRSNGAERTFALTYSFWPWRLITLLAPDFFGHPAQGNYWGYANYWEDHAYMGILPLFLALIAIWHYFRSRLSSRAQIFNPQSLNQDGGRSPIANQIVLFFAALIPVTLVLAMGWNTPIYLWVFDTIPGFNFFQAPARLLIWYTLAVAVLAGVGAQQFNLTPQTRPNWRRLLAACIAVTTAGFMANFFVGGRSLTFLSATQKAGVLLTLSIVLLLLKPNGETPIKDSVWQWIVIIFISFDLLLAGWPLLPTLPPTIYTQPIASAEVIKTQPGEYRFFADETFTYNTTFNQFFQFKDFGPADLEYWQALKETLIPNFGVYAQLPSANNDDPLVVGRWKQFTNVIKTADTEQQARLLALMNAGYFIGSDPAPWPPLYSTQTLVLQNVPGALPRAYFVSQARYVKDSNEALAALTNPKFDPRREVIIIGQETDTSSNARWPADFDRWPVTVRALGPGQLHLSATTPSAGFMVLTDTFYPGWRASVDGQTAEILAANLAFRAVAVESGRNEIIFTYQPASFTFGLWTSLAACLIIMVLLLLITIRKRP